ncbi:MAG: glycosyltransferase [Candidatus Margulisbacteria bacterium]|jgi:glycosyltransferase involved in cell wall biosynthesis|nr:glycosyltransferase [Candidatus Margulisiibacteriota bacterium]
MGEKPKIAIVHDYLVDRGGAERVVIALSRAFPDAPVYTSVYVPQKTFAYFAGQKIFYSRFLTFLARLCGARERIFPLILLYFWRLNLRKYDIVISSSSTFAVQVRHPRHYCYCHTPARFIWRSADYNLAKNPLKQFFLNWIAFFVKPFDLAAARHIHLFIANAENIRKRIQKTYKKKAIVINPPINCASFRPVKKTGGDYFLALSRLKKYKNIDLAVKVFNELKLPLRIAGQGSEKKYLRSIAQKNIKFLGKVTENRLRKLYANCRAFVFPGEEDFGITPLEAQASGRPVIGLGRGGLLETVLDGQTGLFFAEPTAQSLKKTIQDFLKKENKFSSSVIRRHAERFDERVFRKKIIYLIASSHEK